MILAYSIDRGGKIRSEEFWKKEKQMEKNMSTGDFSRESMLMLCS